jgi:hypothetical protein
MPWHMLGDILNTKDRFVPLPSNIRLDQKGLRVTKSLSNYGTELITTIKIFLTHDIE